MLHKRGEVFKWKLEQLRLIDISDYTESWNKNMEEFKKQERYHNHDGSKDLIDRWADEKSPEQFRAIMIAQIEKYCSRYGRKDECIKEIRKIIDYGQRLLAYEMKMGEKVSGK